MNELSVLTEHIQKNASHYFADLDTDKTTIHFINKQVRKTSVLYRFSIESEGEFRAILVKIALPQRERQTQVKGALHLSDRPRLAAITEPQTKVQFEFLALSKIYQRFGTVQNTCFGAIQPLDYLPSFPAIIMIEEQAPNLRQLLIQTHRLQWKRGMRNLEPVFHHAGAWLQIYHRLPKAEHTRLRHGTRNDFITSIHDFCDFLAGQLGSQTFFQTMNTTIAQLANQYLPAELPIGLGHGDYTMRNILVDAADRVTVLDTLCKWQTPIYEDIGYFLARLKAAGPQALAQGFLFNNKQLATYEDAFLCGYWGAEPVPYAQIRLYEVQALLDYWTSQASVLKRIQPQTSIKMTKQQVKLSLMNRFLFTYSNRLLDTIN